MTARFTLDLPRVSAGLGMVVSLLGVGLGTHLTQVKFTMSYTPCLSPYGGCQLGSLTCGAALDAPVSMLLGLPISLWGSAFYLMTASLAAILLLRRDALGGTAAHLLLASAGFAVFVSAVLGAYTALALPSPCPFCLALYAVSVLLLGAALGARRSPEERAAEGRGGRFANIIDCTFIALFVLIFATGTQSMVYHGMRRHVDAQVGCPVPEAELPRAAIKAGAADPEAIVAIFLDMSCSECRREFKLLANALGEAKFSAPVQLWIYQTPRHACDPAAFMHGYRKTVDAARTDNACLAARAAECMEKLHEGQGFALIGGLFALQEVREKDMPLFTAERIGDRAVELGMDIDPDDQQNPLYHCIDNDQAVLARITAHQQFVEDTEFKVPTVVVYRAARGAPDPTRKPLFADARTPLATLNEYVAQQARAEEAP